MPTLYLTGTTAAGHSRVVETRDLASIDYLIAWEMPVGGAKLPRMASDAPLLESASVAPRENRQWSMMRFDAGMRAARHRTNTVDYDVVLAGSITLELDEESILLESGDCVVMNGVVHAWQAGPAGAVVSFVGIGAVPPDEDTGRSLASRHDLIAGPDT